METTQILRHTRLLLVDDCHHNNATLYKLFNEIFAQVTLANNATTAMEYFDRGDIDLVISDICMPGQDGLTFAEAVREKDPVVPIIILTAHSDKEFLLRAANLRLDGYLIKPLNFPKLNAALEKVAHNLESRIKPIEITAQVYYNPLDKSLKIDNEVVMLGNKERTLLELLMQKNKVISKQEIYDKVWPDGDGSEAALKNLLSELRKKLKYDLIRNRHGIGWILEQQAEYAFV